MGFLEMSSSLYTYLAAETRLWVREFLHVAVNLEEFIIYSKPTRWNCGSILFINNYKYALRVADALCVHHQEHYKL